MMAAAEQAAGALPGVDAPWRDVLTALALPGFIISGLLLATVADPKQQARQQGGGGAAAPRKGWGRYNLPVMPDVGGALRGALQQMVRRRRRPAAAAAAAS
jgi:hypothetical protein